MIVFLRWWLVFWLSVAGAVAAGFLGFFPYLWRADASYLSWACLALYALMTAFVGQLSHGARRGNQGFAQHLPLCWFAANTLLGLGMIGTLIGFMLLLQSMTGLGANPDVQKLLQAMMLGFSTAGLTTIVGLACSLLLKLQLINLQYQLRGES